MQRHSAAITDRSTRGRTPAPGRKGRHRGRPSSRQDSLHLLGSNVARRHRHGEHRLQGRIRAAGADETSGLVLLPTGLLCAHRRRASRGTSSHRPGRGSSTGSRLRTRTPLPAPLGGRPRHRGPTTGRSWRRRRRHTTRRRSACRRACTRHDTRGAGTTSGTQRAGVRSRKGKLHDPENAQQPLPIWVVHEPLRQRRVSPGIANARPLRRASRRRRRQHEQPVSSWLCLHVCNKARPRAQRDLIRGCQSAVRPTSAWRLRLTRTSWRQSGSCGSR